MSPRIGDRERADDVHGEARQEHQHASAAGSSSSWPCRRARRSSSSAERRSYSLLEVAELDLPLAVGGLPALQRTLGTLLRPRDDLEQIERERVLRGARHAGPAVAPSLAPRVPELSPRSQHPNLPSCGAEAPPYRAHRERPIRRFGGQEGARDHTAMSARYAWGLTRTGVRTRGATGNSPGVATSSRVLVQDVRHERKEVVLLA